ncbi:hypothetical protein [Horticoccus luteus]|nr:hypothetical protein [Horticoccus luteus]
MNTAAVAGSLVGALTGSASPSAAVLAVNAHSALAASAMRQK